MELPTHCYDCGAYLMGGATEHKPWCSIRKIGEERTTMTRTEKNQKTEPYDEVYEEICEEIYASEYCDNARSSGCGDVVGFAMPDGGIRAVCAVCGKTVAYMQPEDWRDTHPGLDLPPKSD